MARLAPVIRGHLGCPIDPSLYLFSPKESMELANVRRAIEHELNNMRVATKPLPRRTRAAVYSDYFQSWERVEIHKHAYRNGSLIHRVYLIDRGVWIKSPIIFLPPKHLLYKLPPTAVKVELVGLKAAPRPYSTNSDVNVWRADACAMARKIFLKEALVRVNMDNLKGDLYGDIEIRLKGGEGYWSVSKELVARGWAVNCREPQSGPTNQMIIRSASERYEASRMCWEKPKTSYHRELLAVIPEETPKHCNKTFESSQEQDCILLVLGESSTAADCPTVPTGASGCLSAYTQKREVSGRSDVAAQVGDMRAVQSAMRELLVGRRY